MPVESMIQDLIDAFGDDSPSGLVDIGIVSVLDLLDGPKTIYTPALNEQIRYPTPVHYWAATTAGTSAGSEPDFAANEGGTVTDGGVEWTDEGGIPVAGQFHLWALVIPAPGGV